MGFFTDLFKKKPTNVFTETKRENGVVTYETEPQKVLEVSGITVETSFVINKDEVTAALGRKATVLKSAKDWDGAINTLREMQVRMRVSHTHYGVETWCRLALVLQQAGRFNEAEQEFQSLLDNLPRLARKESFMDDPNISFGKTTSKKKIFNLIVSSHTKIIKEKWELAKKREERKLAKLAKIGSCAK